VTSEIPESTLRELITRARTASERAYCPYSRFPVGAAVLTSDGEIFVGCNVENASYGLTICAERSAVFAMVAAGARDIAAVAIYAPTDAPSAPCGACRQVINEFGPHARVISVTEGADRLDVRLSELLPEPFGPRNLGAGTIPVS
jgi:cytidine deaminase